MKIYQFINITPTLSVLNLRVNICRKFNGKYMHGILYFGVMVGLEQLMLMLAMTISWSLIPGSI
jgi:hypothetical protein